IMDIVKDYIEVNSKVQIIGFTDKTGGEDLNLELSKERAKSASQLIGNADIILSAKGENNQLFPYNLPEGRMYSRTVKIIIETPIKE
ncbi:OmpA family protein, partial [Candidatus Kapabacteria bacterium]|nr:OmpA family protein [Candidatus Kapabacteria bacterium]